MKFQFHSQQRSRWPYRRFKNLASTFVEKAKVYGHEGESEKSLAYFTWASRLDPGNLDYLWVIAEYWDEKDAGKAVVALSRIISVAIDVEDLEKAHSRRAASHAVLGKNMNLVDDLDWLINHGFGDAFRLEWRGQYRLKLGNFQGAIEDYSEVLRLSPLSEMTLFQRAEAYLLAQRYNEALNDLEQYYENYSVGIQREWFYIMRGRVYYHLGRHEEALADFRNVTGVTSPLPDAAAYMRKFFRQDMIE